jgi:hypothetical protein
MALRVFIVEDNPLIRTNLIETLVNLAAFHCVHAALLKAQTRFSTSRLNWMLSSTAPALSGFSTSGFFLGM